MRAVPAVPTALMLTAALLLAACAGPLPEPRPVAARLAPAVLTLEMSDGRQCRLPRAGAGFGGAGPEGARPEGVGPEGVAAWGGPVQGCPGVARIEVVPLRPGPVQRVAAGLFEALTLEDLLHPPAEVRVIAPDGRLFVFASPPPG